MKTTVPLYFVAGISLLALLYYGCSGPDEELILIPTEICVRTSHHGQPIPDATVYIKYNAEVSPGFDKPPSYFDASFRTDAQARGCTQSVPFGKHWLVAFGYDSLHYPHHVFGSLPLELSLNGRSKMMNDE
jgi:hypothetical protein